MIDVVDKPRQAGLDPKLKALLDDEEEAKKGYVYCGLCSHVVSHVDQQTEMRGSFDHRFVNPYGFEFHLGCYAEALGCAISGDATAADTWFPGYQWRHATCEECTQHLGWYFSRQNSAEDHHFYGLILDRIQTD